MPAAEVTVYEAGPKALAKVAVTGGGRCNLSNTFEQVDKLSDVYPRGERLIREAFRTFSPEDTHRWWEAEGVCLAEDPPRGGTPGRIFPASQDAMQIVRTLENLMRRLGVELRCGARVAGIAPENSADAPGFTLTFSDGSTARADRVVVTTGGGALALLDGLDIPIVDPVPSLFTFKLADDGIKALTGTVVEDATLSLAGTKFRSRGPLLLTDWGVSGPATLKLSSYAARHLAGSGYSGSLLINWLSAGEDDVRAWLSATKEAAPQKMVASLRPEGLSERCWRHLLTRSGLREDIRWAELGRKGENRLANTLTADCYEITGRSRFKDEFVTAGGVACSAVDPSTLESRRHPGLFFAGEVLDIDAITGGFNLQAAWSTGYLAACKL
jgi:predicted Rossmann fold flavoprotein